MTITTEELARIRAAAVGDMLGDSRAFDGMGPSTVIFRLCRELERGEREADWLAGIVVHRAYCPFPLNCRYPDDPVTLEPTGTCKECILEAAHEAVEEGMPRKGD